MRVGILTLILVAAFLASCGPEGNPSGSEPAFQHVPSGAMLHAERPVPGQYLVVFNEARVAKEAVDAQSDDLARRHGGRVFARWSHALRGFAAHMSAAQAQALAPDPRVAWVEEKAESHLD